MKKFFGMMLLAGGSFLIPSASAANIGFGISIGAPPPARYYAMPPSPGPGFMWVDGYWYPNGGRYAWRNGYWARPPYAGAYWVAPRYNGGRFYNGYWGRGDRDRDGIPNRFDRFDNRRGFGYGYRR